MFSITICSDQEHMCRLGISLDSEDVGETKRPSQAVLLFLFLFLLYPSSDRLWVVTGRCLASRTWEGQKEMRNEIVIWGFSKPGTPSTNYGQNDREVGRILWLSNQSSRMLSTMT